MKLLKFKKIQYKKNNLYNDLKNYIYKNADIKFKIEIEVAERNSYKYPCYWDNFTITFYDVTSTKRYTFTRGHLLAL